MDKASIVNRHISLVRVGDTIRCPDGEIRTVGRKDIKTGFMSKTLFGDSYKLGTTPVPTIIYEQQ